VAPLPNNRVSPRGDYWFTDLKQAYEYPTAQSVTGAGRVIATLISGDFKNADMDAYFSHELLATPKLVRRPVLGGAPFDPSGGSVETTFDIQQLGGMAPGATIVHYNIPDLSDSAIIAGYTAVVEDNVVDILSSSFGGCEKFYQPAYNNGVDMTGVLRVFDDLFRQGNAQGITFVASSGDNGGLGCLDPAYLLTPPTNPPSVVGRFIPGIESPASSPNVTAVGGTNLVTSFNPPSLQSTYVRENADFDPLVPYDPYGVGNLASGGVWQGGGGESIFYAKPLYQLGANTGTTNRAVPDVSLHMGGCPTISNYPKNPSTGRPACPEDRSGDYAILDGQLIGLVGTSASSPDLAGLLALEEQAMGGKRLGNVNVQIYALAVLNAASPSKFYHQNIPGNNGLFTAHPGYNLVVGNGTVIGRNFVGLPNAPPAGDPQTPSNP
jgi:subtilase family serine protease